MSVEASARALVYVLKGEAGLAVLMVCSYCIPKNDHLLTVSGSFSPLIMLKIS